MSTLDLQYENVVDKHNMIVVQSSNLNRIGFNAEDKTIVVEFKGEGGLYLYEDCSLLDFYNLRSSSSVGRTYMTEIRGKKKCECIRKRNKSLQLVADRDEV